MKQTNPTRWLPVSVLGAVVLAAPLAANTAWPAASIAIGLWVMFPVALISVAIEAYVLGRSFKWKYGASFWTAFVANLVSLGVGAVATALFAWFLGPFASTAPGLFEGYPTKGSEQQVLSYGPSLLLMLVVSIMIEVPIVRVMRKVPMSKLWLPCSVANVLTYGFLATVLFVSNPQ